MITYDFMSPKFLKETNISNYAKMQFGVDILENSVQQGDFLHEHLSAILREKKKLLAELYETVLDELEYEGNDISDNECEKLQILVNQILDILFNIDNYGKDLYVDIYMGLLYSSPQKVVRFNDDMKIVWEAKYGAKVNCGNENKKEKNYYPYMDKVDKMSFEIPGGCEEFHRTMISKRNIALFDIGIETQDIKKYGFSSTYMLYQDLKEASIENKLLLEKTMGIGYTNQIFHYTKEFQLREKLI